MYFFVSCCFLHHKPSLSHCSLSHNPSTIFNPTFARIITKTSASTSGIFYFLLGFEQSKELLRMEDLHSVF